MYYHPPPQMVSFDVVVRLAWSKDPESYAGGGMATVRASHSGRIKGDYPDEKGYPGPPGWGLGIRLTTSPHKRVENLSDAMERIDKQKAIWL